MHTPWLDSVLGSIQVIVEALPWWVWAIVVGVLIAWFTNKPLKHAWRIRQADRTICRLKKIGKNLGAPAQFGFLRKSVDPFVFEEAILTALAKRKLRIIRNRRYTGDGGIDGRCYYRGRLVLIQAKKYSNHINPQDVQKHVAICRRHKALGLFVHTGKTGPASRQSACPDLDIISGTRMLSLLCGEEIALFPQAQ